MTTRIFEFQRSAEMHAESLRDRSQPRIRVSLTGAALTALVVAPIAGIGEGPTGLLVSAATGLLMLHLAAILGTRLPWGWLTVLLAMLGLALPRGPWPFIGPALFVATAVALAVWFAARDLQRRKRKADRPRPGSPERAAQVMLGFSGERHVGRVLATELPQEYAVFNGLSLARGAGDIDHLVVGPTGVFVLETKTMAGDIVCGPDHVWRRTRTGRAGTTYPAYIGDPSAQVQRNIFALRHLLRRRLPDLFIHTPLWIEGLVVFPHSRTRLDAPGSKVPAVVLEDMTQRIRTHRPRRPLGPSEVDHIVAALLEEGQAERQAVEAAPPMRQTAQALVELALVLPLVLGVLLGTVAVSRIVQARTAVIAVAHEAARAAALGDSPADAMVRMRERANLVAPGVGLETRNLILGWDVSHFSANPAEVIATIDYPVDLSDLPLIGGLPAVVVHAQHTEWVDPFRSGIPLPDGGRP